MRDILSKAVKLNAALLKIESNRQLWQRETKPLLVRVLNQINDEAKLNLVVKVDARHQNHERVNLSFEPKPSGIVEMLEDSQRSLLKIGGSLAFCQSYNGDIYPFVAFPYVEDVVIRNENLLLVKLDPRRITEEFVVARVNDFLSAMLEWEQVTSGAYTGLLVVPSRA